jgi:hypothetical protein
MLDNIGRFPLYLRMFHLAFTVLTRRDDYRIHKHANCSTLIEFKMLSRIAKSGLPKMGIGLSCSVERRIPAHCRLRRLCDSLFGDNGNHNE